MKSAIQRVYLKKEKVHNLSLKYKETSVRQSVQQSGKSRFFERAFVRLRGFRVRLGLGQVFEKGVSIQVNADSRTNAPSDQ